MSDLASFYYSVQIVPPPLTLNELSLLLLRFTAQVCVCFKIIQIDITVKFESFIYLKMYLMVIFI